MPTTTGLLLLEPTPADSALAQGSAAVFEELARVSQAPAVCLMSTGPVEGAALVPRTLLPVIAHLLRAFASGQSVLVSSTDAEMTTQEAADLLGVSRPTLIELLDTYQIPHRRPGKHRRIPVVEVMRLKERLDAHPDRPGRQERLTALRQMAEYTDRLGLGY